MDDLVKRLREHTAVLFDDYGHALENTDLCDDAADRIDADAKRIAELEAALRKLSTAQCLGNGEVLGMSLSDHPLGREILARMEIARAALGEKKDG